MIAEIICVGTELLLGNTVNTNGTFLAERCAYLGMSCYYQTVVGDNPDRLRDVIKTALGRSDVLILSGGLGPTEDDLTKETAADVLNIPLIMHEESKEHIISYLAGRGRKITDNNWKQAMVPEGSIVLKNANGTAPGIIIDTEGKITVLLPGPPGELVPMFLNQVEPYLASKSGDAAIYSRMVKLVGVGESTAEEEISDLISGTNPTVATYAKVGEVHIRVTARADDMESAIRLVKPVVRDLKSRFGVAVYTTEPEVTLEDSIIELMSKNNMKLVTAESCTGGMVAARLINVSGASEVFAEGFITYSNEAKRNRLEVKKSTLQKYGAVSRETADEMASGGCKVSGADACVAITGIAGPLGGTNEKPVGLVYIGCCVCGKTTVKEYHFHGNRNKIRESATCAALTLLRECLLIHLSECL